MFVNPKININYINLNNECHKVREAVYDLERQRYNNSILLREKDIMVEGLKENTESLYNKYFTKNNTIIRSSFVTQII